MATQAQIWQQSTTGDMARGRLATAGLWILQIAVAALFLFAGTAKLTGDPMMVQLFALIGAGQWFRYVTGTIEVIGATLLLIPRLALFGALAIAVTMVGAIITHLFVVGGNPVLPVVLLGVTGIIARARRLRR
jgi:putative oxidoreductase